MQELTLEELSAVAAGNMLTTVGGTIMATGAAGAGVGALFGQPEIVVAGTVIAGVGGLVYLAGEL